MWNRQLLFSPRIPYNLVAESAEKADKLHEATAPCLQFPVWWTRRDSNPRSLVCHTNAFPLSYGP